MKRIASPTYGYTQFRNVAVEVRTGALCFVLSWASDSHSVCFRCIRRGPGPALEFLNASFEGQKWVPASRTTVYGSTPWTMDKYQGWEAKIGQTVGGQGFSAACWFFGRELYKRRKYPIGLIWSSIGGSRDEVWMPPSAFATCNSQAITGDGWDLMTAPLLRNVIAGVVWYQGESNENNPLGYNCSFPAMIAAWRQEWYNATKGETEPLFPFGFVQLSVHGGLPCYSGTSCYNQPTWSTGYAAIRWAQTASHGTVPNSAMPNVFMATAVDLGEPQTPAGGPHVRDKQDVGSRLALAFRDNFVSGDGPFYTPGAVAASASTSVSTSSSSSSIVDIIFTNLPPVQSPLLPPDSTLGLEVTSGSDADAIWTNVSSVTVSGKTVHVTCSLTAVKQVRYLWSDNACLGWNSTTATRETDARFRCPLYAITGLPVLPFILNVSTSSN